MDGKDRWIKKIALGADLPSEAVPGMPLVEILGCQRVLIENHKGVTMYTNNEIQVKVLYGHLSVCGKDLELARMTMQQLVIVGQIEGVSVCRGVKL